MSDMMAQRNRQRAMRESAERNTITDDQGNTTFNKKGYMSDVFKFNPQMAMKMQQQDTAREALAEEKKFNKHDEPIFE